MSTPIDVPCSASNRVSGASGSAGAQDRVPGERRAAPSRRTSRRARRAPTSGWSAAGSSPIRSTPMRCSASAVSPRPATRGDGERGAARDAAHARAPVPALGRRARGSAAARRRRRAGRRPARARGAGRRARGASRRAARALAGGDRLLVDPDDLARRRAARRSGARARRPRRPSPRGARGASARSRSVSASAIASPRGTSTPSTPSRTTSR